MHAGALLGFSFMPLLGIPVILLIGGVILGVAGWGIYRNRKRFMLIENTQLVQVQDLQPGLFQLHGHAVAMGPLLRSPLTNSECVYFRFLLEEQRTRTVDAGPRGGSRVEKYWHPVIDDAQATQAAIDDGTGWAEVELKDAEVVLKVSAARNSGSFQSAPPDVKKRLEKKYNHSTKGWFFEKTTRYSEMLVKEGDDLFVLGEAVPRDDKGKRFCVVKGEHPLLVSDKDASGLAAHYKRYYYLSIAGAGLGVLLILVCSGIFTVMAVAIPSMP
jgi:hypothetical protein